MTLFGYTLRFLRGRRLLRLSELAERTGISEVTLQNIENGYIEPEMDIAARLAAFFDVTVGYMKGSVEVCMPQGDREAKASARFVRLQPRPLDPELYEQNILRSAEVREVVLPVPLSDRNEYIAVVATDNTMRRYCVFAGDVLVVQSGLGGLRNGDLAILKTQNEQVILRRFYKAGDELIFRSDEDDLLPPLHLRAETEGIRIVGKVLEIIKKVSPDFLALRAQNPPGEPEEILPPPQMPLSAEKNAAEKSHTYTF